MTLLFKLALIGHVASGLLALVFYYGLIPNLLHKNINLPFLKRFSALGFAALLASWILGAYYYLNYYGKHVKPEILHGKLPWAHKILTETKEHIFLFLPFMGLVLLISLLTSKHDITEVDGLQSALSKLSLAIVAIGTAVTIFGMVISGAT